MLMLNHNQLVTVINLLVDFNTSYVNVKLMRKMLVVELVIHFNTSYVNVKPNVCMRLRLAISISIHLMLMLNLIPRTLSVNRLYFNTSYVNVKPNIDFQIIQND